MSEWKKRRHQRGILSRRTDLEGQKLLVKQLYSVLARGSFELNMSARVIFILNH